MYADANGSHSIPEFLADKMVETKIWNRRKTLVFQSVVRTVPRKAGIHFGQRIPKLDPGVPAQRANTNPGNSGRRAEGVGSHSATRYESSVDKDCAPSPSIAISAKAENTRQSLADIVAILCTEGYTVVVKLIAYIHTRSIFYLPFNIFYFLFNILFNTSDPSVEMSKDPS